MRTFELQLYRVFLTQTLLLLEYVEDFEVAGRVDEIRIAWSEHSHFPRVCEAAR